MVRAIWRADTKLRTRGNVPGIPPSFAAPKLLYTVWRMKDLYLIEKKKIANYVAMKMQQEIEAISFLITDLQDNGDLGS